MAKNQGTLATSSIRPNDTEDVFPVTYSNENKGGRHIYNTITECVAKLPHERMEADMLVVIREDRTQARPRTIYTLRKLPWKKNTEPDTPILELPANFTGEGYTKVILTNDNFFEYFELESQGSELVGDYIEEFAPDYNGSYYDTQPDWMNKQEPPFPYDKDSVWNNANWSTTLDPSLHKWKRHRYGTGNPSKPYPLFSNSKPGDYVDIRQKYVINGTVPPTPEYTLTGGVLNNEPEGWQDIAVMPTGGTISTYSLWEIRAQKNEFGQLKTPWTAPKIIPVNPDLIRYNSEYTSDPNKIMSDIAGGGDPLAVSSADGSPADTALKSAGWEPVLNHKIHKYRASRQKLTATTYSSWSIEKIGQESGEYPEFIYREFPESLLDYILDNPNATYSSAMGGDGKPFRPKEKNPTAWKDKAFNPTEGNVVFRSSCIKFSNGELKTPWSDPVPDGQKNTPIDFIRSDSGNDFKYNQNGVCLNPTITLTAFLYSGERLINTDAGETVTYDWKRIYNGGGDTTLTAADDFGTARTATITNDKVDGQAIFRCIQTWTNAAGTSKTFISEYEILDVKDGRNARLIKLTSTAYAFVQQDGGTTPAQISLRVFTENISDNNATPELEFTWKRRPVGVLTWETLVETTNTLNVVPTAFDTNYNEYIYRVEITDSLNVLHFDEVNLHRLSLQNGSDAFAVILSNPQDTVPTNPDGTLVDSGLTSNYTTYQVFEGITEATSSFDTITATVEDVTLADPAGTANTVTVSVDTVAKKVKVTAWGTNVQAATVTIKFVRTSDSKTLFKDFKLKRQKGYDSIYILDIDATPNGFAFAPGDTVAKTLTANVFRNGSPIDDSEYAGLTIKWFDEFAGYDITTVNLFDQTPLATGRTASVGPERVDFKNNVICMVQLPSGQRLTRTVVLTEVKDAREMMILYIGGTSTPTAPSGLTYDAYIALSLTTKYQGWFKDPGLEPFIWEARKHPEGNSWRIVKVVGEDGVGLNGGYKLSYYCVAAKATNILKPNNDRTPLDANKNEKSSFTDQNGIVWYKDLSRLSYNKDTQRVWEVFTFITYSPTNVRQFLYWEKPVAITAVDGVSIKGEDGVDGAKIHILQAPDIYPWSGLGKDGDMSIGADADKTLYTKISGSWYPRGPLKGNIGPSPSHQWGSVTPSLLRFQNPDGTWGTWTDLKGPKGNDGVFNASDFWETTTYFMDVTVSNASIKIKFRKNKAGIVYYQGYITGSSSGWFEYPIPDAYRWLNVVNLGSVGVPLNVLHQDNAPNVDTKPYLKLQTSSASGTLKYVIRGYIGGGWYMNVSGSYIATGALGW